MTTTTRELAVETDVIVKEFYCDCLYKNLPGRIVRYFWSHGVRLMVVDMGCWGLHSFHPCDGNVIAAEAAQ